MTLTADRQRAEPGESVTLTVQSLPTSVVGVLVQEDFGNRGNVITAEEVSHKSTLIVNVVSILSVISCFNYDIRYFILRLTQVLFISAERTNLRNLQTAVK